MSPRRPGASVRLVTALVTTVLLACAATPASAKPAAPKLTAALAAASIQTGQGVTLSGKLRPAAKRTVRLEQQRGKAWTTLATGRSTKRGVFSLTAPMATAGTFVLRARAPKRGKAKAVTSAKLTLTVTAPPVVLPPCCKPAVAPPPAPIITPSAAKASFRVLSVLTADQTEPADQLAALRSTVQAVSEGFFAKQTDKNVQPRWVRDAAGQVVVTTVRLPLTQAEYEAAGSKVFAALRTAIEIAAPAPTGQLTVAFARVGDPTACGTTGDGYSIMENSERSCWGSRPVAGSLWPFGGTYLLAHEMTHLFGVPFHVTNDNRDVLYMQAAPGAPGRDWDNLTLDPGHDDYYDTPAGSPVNIATSPYWTATTDPLS